LAHSNHENFHIKFILIEEMHRLLIIKNEISTSLKRILVQDEYIKFQKSVSFIREKIKVISES